MPKHGKDNFTSPSCVCDGTRQERMARWEITMYRVNYSAFNGGHRTPSDYSEIHCKGCGRHWRTKAAYVSKLEHAHSAL